MADAIRVAFDATPVITGRTGIARYVTQLGIALEEAGVVVRRFVVGRAAVAPPPGTRWMKVPLRVIQASWRLTGRPRAEDLVPGVDLVHAGGPVPPPTRLPLVVTVYDLAPLDHPELHPVRHAVQAKAQLERTRAASAVVAISETTRQGLVARGVAAERIVVSPLGVTPLPAPADHRLGPQPFLLALGETSARKGYPTLVRAFAKVADRELRLVVAGPEAAGETELSTAVADAGLGSRFVRVQSVSDAVLAALYRDAVALCFPSVAEGFGLPVLEALAAGLPVIASDLPVLREVTGDTAVHVPKDDEAAWAAAIESVSSNDGLRRRLADEGRQRAARFTWAATARATLDAYRRALG